MKMFKFLILIVLIAFSVTMAFADDSEHEKCMEKCGAWKKAQAEKKLLTGINCHHACTAKTVGHLWDQ